MDHFLKDASFMKLFLHSYSAMIAMPLWLGSFANVGVLSLTPWILSFERFPSLFRTCIVLLDYLSLDLFMIRCYRVWKSYLMMQRSPHSHQVVETYFLHIIEFALRWREVFSQVSLLSVILYKGFMKYAKPLKNSTRNKV